MLTAQTENNRKGLALDVNFCHFVFTFFTSVVTPDIYIELTGCMLSLQGFDKIDIVIEAVFEDLNIKHKVIKEIEEVLYQYRQ